MLNDQEKTILMCYVFSIFSALEVGLYSSNILIKTHIMKNYLILNLIKNYSFLFLCLL